MDRQQDNSRIHLVIGPPGTGKTTYLSRQIARAAERYTEGRVLVTSLTRSAAAAISGKIELPERNVGTLHSICYRLLQHPELALKAKHLEAWNATHPGWQIAPVEGTAVDKGDDPYSVQSDGIMEKVDVLRHRMTPTESWPEDFRLFHEAWTAFKRDTGTVDFTDMIEEVAIGNPYPPGDIAVLVVDEGQDLSALETQVIRNWSGTVEHTVVAGDRDQVLYDWRGAYPELFLPGVVPDQNIHVLGQSYRVPKASHAFAVRLINQCSNRRVIEYLPTEVEGSVQFGGPPFIGPARLIDELAEEHASNPELGTLMFIAPCAFTVEPIMKALRARGLPFHNPYRRRNGRWNPISPRKGVSLSDRLLAFTSLNRTGALWTADQMRAWVGGLSVEQALVRGIKSSMAADDYEPPRTVEQLAAMLRNPGEVNQVISGNLDWYAANAANAYRDKMEYPLKISRRFGVGRLEETPRIIVGTIHSVKGGEAETVVMAPDLSGQGVDTMTLDPDSIRRLMYVGATRAKRDLHIPRPSREWSHAGRLW